MDTFKYICRYCHEQYIPKRRHFQKFCSNSCRSKAYHRRQIEAGLLNNKTTGNKDVVPGQLPRSKEPTIPKKQSVEKMSTAGVGNVVAGTLIADLITRIVQGDGNRPATKNDIAMMMNKFQRYHLITNRPPNRFGKLPYFDFHTNKLEYF